ncbi:hypothetical protein C1I97_26680, partial [Streptomyces sp. NTH33]
WGLNDVMLLAGVTDGAEVVFAFAEAREQPGLRPSPPMRFAALTASRTVSLRLDGRSLDLGSRAQRLFREGMFLLVQGQMAEVRRAHLGHLGD